MSDQQQAPVTHVRLTGRQHKTIVDRLGENVPLEVVTLLAILARIEARRRRENELKEAV